MEFLGGMLGGIVIQGALSGVLSAIVVLIICLIVTSILMKVVNALLEKSRLDKTLTHFFSKGAELLLRALTVIIVAETLGIPTASLVTVMGVAGLALSLSLQNILSNLFSGITLLLTHPFKSGDYVIAAGNEGIVRNVSLFYTTMDTLDNKLISIPNSDVIGASVNNFSTQPTRRVDFVFGASYDSATEDVYDAIDDAIASDDKILKDPAPFRAIIEYKDSSISYVVRVWCRNADYWDVYFHMNEKIRETFKKHGVEMSYNHLNVHVDQAK